MKTILKRAFLFSLACMLVLFSTGFTAAAEENKPEPVSFSFLNAMETADSTTECYYSDTYFYLPGAIANIHLRTMSYAMAMAAFERYSEEDDYTNGCKNFDELMEKCGFTDFSHNKAFDEKPTEDSIGLAAASKKITAYGVDYTLIALGVRGAGYEAEWAGNLKVGEEGQADGFATIKDQTLAFLSEYEKKYGITDHAKIWIAGFSRGGAAANLATAAINEDPAAYHTTRNDIYCYTFEAPQAEDAANTGQYYNIHNMVYAADAVPLLPFSEWGLTRAGHVSAGASATYPRDDFILPGPESEEYQTRKEAMLKHLAKITPNLAFAGDDFSEVRLSIFDTSPLPGRTQSEFILEMTEWLNSTLTDKSRKSYAENYQEAFSTLARIFFGAKQQQISKVSVAFKAAVKDPEFYALAGVTAAAVQLHGILNNEEYDKEIQNCAEKLGENLVSHMKEAGVGFSEEDYEAFKDCLFPIIIFADGAIKDDVFHCSGYHIGTLLSNVEPLIQAHCPDVLLAWLETYDSYYE